MADYHGIQFVKISFFLANMENIIKATYEHMSILYILLRFW